MQELVILVALTTTLVSFIIACLSFTKMGQVEEAFIDLAEEIQDYKDKVIESEKVKRCMMMKELGVSNVDIIAIEEKFKQD